MRVVELVEPGVERFHAERWVVARDVLPARHHTRMPDGADAPLGLQVDGLILGKGRGGAAEAIRPLLCELAVLAEDDRHVRVADLGGDTDSR